MRWDLFAVLMLLPWAATFGGSLMAARIGLGSAKRQGALLGFAAGIMIAASVWSLIVPDFSDANYKQQFINRMNDRMKFVKSRETEKGGIDKLPQRLAAKCRTL